MSEGWQEKLDSLVSIEADIDVEVTQEGDDKVYLLHLLNIKRTKGDIQDGTYKAIILALRQPTVDEESIC